MQIGGTRASPSKSETVPPKSGRAFTLLYMEFQNVALY